MTYRSQMAFITADEFRQWLRLRYPRENGYTHERIGEELGLSSGFVGMLLDGTRKPSNAALEALEWGAVTLYRRKNDPFTGKPWGEADPRGPFFSTQWERDDYERRQRSEPELGPR